MKKLSQKAFEPLDQEEKDLMESIEREEWRSVKNIKLEKEKALAAVRNTLKKDKRINLRHSLRHTHASWLVQAGTDLFTVQKQLGHTTATMTQRYSHLHENHFKAVTKVFDDTKKSEQRAKVLPMTQRGS